MNQFSYWQLSSILPSIEESCGVCPKQAKAKLDSRLFIFKFIQANHKLAYAMSTYSRKAASVEAPKSGIGFQV